MNVQQRIAKLRIYLWVMGKLQDRKAELVDRIQKVRSKKILDAVEQALAGEVEPLLTDQELAELEAIKQSYLRGETTGKPWAEVKARLLDELKR